MTTQLLLTAALAICWAGFVCSTVDAIRTVRRIRREKRIARVMLRVKGY